MEIRKHPVPTRGPYRPYDSDGLTRAYLSVQNKELSIRKASVTYGVPYATLADRISGKISVDTVKSGVMPLFSQEHEALLAQHLTTMAEVGYGYTRQETMNLATDYAIELGLRMKSDNTLSDKWLYNFLGRWPELVLKKPRALEVARAKSATRQAVDNYFTELKKILVKYGLENKPNRIFNVDEKGLKTDHKPPKIVAGKFNKTQAVTSGKSQLTTLIGCVNGVGQQIPPFFVFPGARMMDGLMEGSSPGSMGTVSPTGWSNTEIFCQFMKDHLLKYLPSRDNDYVLVMYDGHKSHCSLGLIEWAKSQKIILFVLPPHCSHILQPLDVSCFGPFEVAWNAACHKYIRESGGRLINRYNVCQLACKVYSTTLTVPNIVAAFRKCGVVPFNSAVVPDSIVAPAMTFKSPNPPSAECSSNSDFTKTAENFLLTKGGTILANVQTATKVRNTLSKVIGGKPITEDDIVEKIRDHTDKQKKCSTTKNTSLKSPRASTSGIPVKKAKISQNNYVNNFSDSEEEICEEEKCIVCKKFSPDTTRFPFIILVKWGCCDKCHGWVHLVFCTHVRVLRCGSPFLCPTCETMEID